MENFIGRMRQNKLFGHLPKKQELNMAFSSFSRREWAVFILFLLVLIFSTLGLLQAVNKHFMVTVPAHGGSISEGIIGTPRFVNPLLASSPTDQDLTSLIYSGLMRKNSDGTLSLDLASKYEEGEDGLSYTFTLRDNLFFHDDTPLTTDDIIFTINQARDPLTKSAQKINWDRVNVKKVDDKTIEFSVRDAYPAFLENMTLGIMPTHIWSDSPIELHEANTNPIGSGPYKIKNVSRESSGTIEGYDLTAFKKFALGEPYIKNISIHFYQNEKELTDALTEGTVDQISSITPSTAKDLADKGYTVESAVLPRVFGLFFNQNQNQLFINKTVTNAIDQAIDKDRIVREVLSGYGTVIDDPIPPNLVEYQTLKTTSTPSRADTIAKVEAALAKDGWVKNASQFLEKTVTEKGKKSTIPLAFSISTSNAPELVAAAEIVKENLVALGMNVDIKTFEVGNLNQSVIRPREYDVLLFGQIINYESDLYAFWHSSQRKDPGLNIAMYTNAKVDKILEEAFTLTDEEARVEKYLQFESEIKKDMPAVFLYSPNFIYVTEKKLQGFSLKHIIIPGDRFGNVNSWYIDNEQVWKIFIK